MYALVGGGGGGGGGGREGLLQNQHLHVVLTMYMYGGGGNYTINDLRPLKVQCTWEVCCPLIMGSLHSH